LAGIATLKETPWVVVVAEVAEVAAVVVVVVVVVIIVITEVDARRGSAQVARVLDKSS
jgi:hypothetical protein